MSVDTTGVAAAAARAKPKSRHPKGAPASHGGRFAASVNDDSAVALEALFADRDAFWVVGTPHPGGGYDTILEDPETGSTFYMQDGLIHNEAGPAVVFADGTEQWYYEGALHRDDDLPAVMLSTGEREWYAYGAQHRDGDLPAVIHPDGTAVYLQDGKLHRGGGRPAVIYPSGHTEWWVEGGRHRPVEYGPAKIRSNGEEEFWENGKRVADLHRGV